VIFVDSNIPMYLVGADHPLKHDAQRMLERASASGLTLASSAEVVQEILHRYAAIGRPDAIAPAVNALVAVLDVLLPVEFEDALRARDLILTLPGISARDCLHVAVMERHAIKRIMSFDAGFDRVPGLDRVRPNAL